MNTMGIIKIILQILELETEEMSLEQVIVRHYMPPI